MRQEDDLDENVILLGNAKKKSVGSLCCSGLGTVLKFLFYRPKPESYKGALWWPGLFGAGTATNIALAQNFVCDCLWGFLAYYMFDLEAKITGNWYSQLYAQMGIPIAGMILTSVIAHIICKCLDIKADPKDTLTSLTGASFAIPGWNFGQAWFLNFGKKLGLDPSNAGYFASLGTGGMGGPIQQFADSVSKLLRNDTRYFTGEGENGNVRFTAEGVKNLFLDLVTGVIPGMLAGGVWQLVFQLFIDLGAVPLLYGPQTFWLILAGSLAIGAGVGLSNSLHAGILKDAMQVLLQTIFCCQSKTPVNQEFNSVNIQNGDNKHDDENSQFYQTFNEEDVIKTVSNIEVPNKGKTDSTSGNTNLDDQQNSLSTTLTDLPETEFLRKPKQSSSNSVGSYLTSFFTTQKPSDTKEDSQSNSMQLDPRTKPGQPQSETQKKSSTSSVSSSYGSYFYNMTSSLVSSTVTGVGKVVTKVVTPFTSVSDKNLDQAFKNFDLDSKAQTLTVGG